MVRVAKALLSHLEGRLGVLEQHLKVGLVPRTSLGRWLVGIRLAAERVVARGARVAGAVGLAAGLDPDEGIGELEAGAAARAEAEAGAVDVAPVAPLETEALDAVAARVDDGVVGHAGRLESGAEEGDILLLVLGLVVLAVWGVGEFTGLGVPEVHDVSETVPLCVVSTFHSMGM